MKMVYNLSLKENKVMWNINSKFKKAFRNGFQRNLIIKLPAADRKKFWNKWIRFFVFIDRILSKEQRNLL